MILLSPVCPPHLLKLAIRGALCHAADAQHLVRSDPRYFSSCTKNTDLPPQLCSERQSCSTGGLKCNNTDRPRHTCLPCFKIVGLVATLRCAAPRSPPGPNRPNRAVGRFREGIWNWRGFRLPIPAPTEPAVGKEFDWPKPRLERGKKNNRSENSKS